MKNSLIAFILTLTFLITGCSQDGEPAERSSVNIRLTNTSSFDYAEVYVSTGGGGEFTYGDVNSNATTEYHEFDSAFPYAYIELKIGNEEYKLQPVDFVGEKELAGGNYTYEIDAKQVGGTYDKLTLDLVAD